ncbi:uracil phosphoribosyltransferase [Colletotrichum graminicola]|uniref:Uracil phosphoribosyltransferase n=1 Tax=Colletotrichum graminicola (strain M1.001 / M2 / FGSC 10212) TaxID=645133 RepID=E3QN18_COLGM|nr:uracil phosphoribosyltransferase [Colletotrichum graminicola M1.001]EFQ32256.1 uracil phosphoribosyltransferase [Colletotrichum graminicola M1.001]WDK19828.1 uracil phosphoribosyltransferase [Colletotrichum graminicola]
MAASDKARPIVVGLYGVPGCGKSFLLGKLKSKLNHEHFQFFEGSDAIDRVVPGGLEVFKRSDDQKKLHWRQMAIDAIAKECTRAGRVGVVTGHFLFWPQVSSATYEAVCTDRDLRVYTHILYLDVPADVVVERSREDTVRCRQPLPVDHIRKWQDTEKKQLRRLCLENGILFGTISPDPSLLDSILPLLHDIRLHSEKENLSRVNSRVDEVVLTMQRENKIATMVVLDADRTLCAMDTGTMFWEKLRESQSSKEECPLRALFSSHLGYSYSAFRQATFLYEESRSDFDSLCSEVASAVTMHPEFLALIRALEREPSTGAVVVTCGIRRVWEKVLEREGFSQSVKVIGGGRVADGYVVDPLAKGAVVSKLRDHHGLYVWAFGDSPVDLPMLKLANQAVVVVGEYQTRSRSMDAVLLKAIDEDNLRPRQALIPEFSTLRLDSDKLPIVNIASQAFIKSITSRRCLQVVHATAKNAAKLLMTPTRDAAIAGHSLRAAHHQVGWYLATEFLTSVLGVEEYPIAHVQGRTTDGYRLLDEDSTVIVALMRGGEPMALGVSEAFPKAMFLHAGSPKDLNSENLAGKQTVLLVDSVVNSGKTIVEFVEQIRKLDTIKRIVVVAGVVQEKAVSGVLEPLANATDLSLVALRLSENKFTGKGGTDTGNRLFNTTQLP